MPMTGHDQRVATVAEEIITAAHAGDRAEARRIAAHSPDIALELISELAARCPALPVTDVFAARRRRVEQIRTMQANGVPDRVIAAKLARHHTGGGR